MGSDMGRVLGMIQSVAVVAALYSNIPVGSASQPIADAFQGSEVDQLSIEYADPTSDQTVAPPVAEQGLISDRALPHLPALTGCVVDEAEIIDPADEQALTTHLSRYESDTTNQIVVATVKYLRGMP